MRFLSWTTITFFASIAVNNYPLFLTTLYTASHLILLHYHTISYIMLFNPFLSAILFVDLSLTSFAALFYKINDQYVDKAEYLILEVGEEENKPMHSEYTAAKYNNTVTAFLNRRASHYVDLAGITMLLGSILSGGPVVNRLLDEVVNLTKFSWIVSTPHLMLQNAGLMVFNKRHFLIDTEKIIANAGRLMGKKVVFILPTSGKNLKTVAKSVHSVVYWGESVRHKLDDIPAVMSWVVAEEDNYMDNLEYYEDIRRIGCRVIVVPKNFQTANKTQYKARALTYVLEVMRQEQLATENVWIYHQDDETMVGEDSMFGIMDFIQSASPTDVYAAGIIIYADGWRVTVSQAQEPARSYDDMRILFTTKTKGMLSFGHHGSHLLVRADAEERIGWDFGNVKTEDWLFGLKLCQEYRPTKTILKGFGYEKPPLTVKDLLRQRRRWAQGALQVLRRRDVRLRYRLAALYGVVSWLSALPSLIAFLLNIINPTGGLFIGSGALAGFTWFSLFKYYQKGYELNKPYMKGLEKTLKNKVKSVSAIAFGMLLESFSPWYALVRPAKDFEVIAKDE